MSSSYYIEITCAHYNEMKQEIERLTAEVASLRGENKSATDMAKKIHQCLKRGEATEDHGLCGNLSCILDHVSAEVDKI